MFVSDIQNSLCVREREREAERRNKEFKPLHVRKLTNEERADEQGVES